MDCLLHIDPDARRQRVLARLVRDPRWGQAQRDAVDGAVAALSAVFDRLAAARPTSPSTAPWASEHRWQAGAGDAPEWDLELRPAGVHPVFWRVLAGVLAGCGILELRARGDGPADANQPLDWPALAALPRYRLPAPPPFPVRLRESPKRTDRLTFQWVFDAPLSDATLAPVLESIDAWGLLITGGFPPPGLEPADALSQAVPPYAADRFTIEHRAVPWASDPEAIEVLVGLAQWIHRSAAPLAEMSIE